MNPITSLATTAVAVLSLYLAEAANEFAKETGKAAAGKIGALDKALKALTDLKSHPTNKDTHFVWSLLFKKVSTIFS